MAERASLSLRARITLIATAVVAVVMVGGSLAFAAVLRASVHDATARGGETRVEELAGRVEDRGPDAMSALDDDLAWLVDDGRVLAASEEADGVAPPRAGDGAEATVGGDRVLIVTEDVGDSRALVLAVPLDDEDETVGTVATLLAVSTVLVTLLVAGVTWWVVGRALRPVARIRSEVDEITVDRLDRRVAEPASGDEIAALAATMNRMLDRLDAGATAQRRFVSDASHELRSPLATMRQHAEVARAHPEASSLAELAEVVAEEGVRMQELVDGLLLLTRLDERAPTAGGAVDLDDLALAEVRRLRAAGVTVDGSGIGAARASGDPRLLGRAVRNLADNAARHARSRVALRVAEEGGRAVLVVEDDGAGIPPAERERVFERFVRLDEARARDAGGSGLGLAIVRGVVEAAGGTVTADASPLGGARSTVRLPVAD